MKLPNNDVDIHFQVVDNYGDAGIALRLARLYLEYCSLANVRLFIDDIQLLHLLDNSISPKLATQTVAGIKFIDITKISITEVTPAPLVIQLLATALPLEYELKVFEQSKLVIVLEGVTAEAWGKEVHGSQSHIEGSARKFFYIPGFDEHSGGILVGNGSASKYSKDYFVKENAISDDDGLIGVLFNYGDEVNQLVNALSKSEKNVYLFVCGEKSQKVFKNIDLVKGNLRLIFPRFYEQTEFDELLRVSDFNFIRGEDSLMQAINASNPFFWQLYPQSDSVHLLKLNAFIEMMESSFEDNQQFNNFKTIFHYYNSVCSLKDEEIEDIIYSFINNLDKIRLNFHKLRSKIQENGTLIERLFKFIEQI